MAESSKKQPRKSKLVPRDCIDLEEDKNAFTEMQIPSQSLLPKLKTAIETESLTENPPSPVQFDIQVEMEAVYDDNMSQYLRPEHDTDSNVVNNEWIRTHEVIISNDAIRCEVEKLLSTNSYSDRIIGVEILNSWGKNLTPHVPDYYEELVQNVLQEWKIWYTQSKIRTTILAYKCDICSMGWWHLGPFWEHIKIHKELSLRLDSVHHECWVVAAQGQWYEDICLCKIEGNCPKCLKTYEEHKTLKQGSMFYHCSGCGDKFTTCFNLFAHEGLCVRYEKIVFQNAIPTESMWRCDICGVTCLTQERYDQHRLGFHSVRSDCPLIPPQLRACVLCGVRYVVYPVHACAKRAGSLKCKYCKRRFQNKVFLDIHLNNTKKNRNCMICKRYLASQCMEVEHLIKHHNSSYTSVIKCYECLDHVLMINGNLLRKHRSEWHCRRGDKRRPNTPRMLVPRSCMSSAWAEGVSVGDMVIEQFKPETLKAVEGKIDVPDSLKDVIKKMQEQEAEKARMEEMCNDLKNKMLKRASANVASRPAGDTGPDSETKQKNQNDELLNALEGLRNENDSNTDRINEIKQEYCDDDVMVTDDDIMETQNSVDALLTGVAIKDEIKSEEHWDHIVIDDSQDEDENFQDIFTSFVLTKQETVDQEETSKKSVYQEENAQNIIKLEKSNHATVKDKIDLNDSENDTNGSQKDLYENQNLQEIFKKDNSANKKVSNRETEKQKPETKDCNITENKDKENIIKNIDKTVFIKEENKDYNEYENETENEREKDAFLEELSKVFRASKDATKIELSGISLSEDVNIKEELIDEDEYEDDIIMLQDHVPTFDLTESETITEDSKQNSTSDVSKDLNSETDTARQEPRVNIMSGRYKRIITGSGKEVIYRDKKIYRCYRCCFSGDYKAFYNHKATVCEPKKHKKTGTKRNAYSGKPWPKMACSECGRTYRNLPSYFNHFHKHGLKRGRCPACPQRHVEPGKEAAHLLAHIKTSFIKIQLLKVGAVGSEKVKINNNRLSQCKVCQADVQFKNFFSHWESHLQLSNEESEDTESLVENEEATAEESKDTITSLLTKEQSKILLDQLVLPEKMYEKQCALCQRQFGRRNDVKRHAIEHLLQDARARQPAPEPAARPKRNLWRIESAGFALVCQLCNHRSTKADAYKTHMRNHASLPVYRCDLCDKCFSDSSNYAKHKKVHNLQVLSVCDLCKKKFTTKLALEKHMEMHRSTEPFPCKECNRIYYTQTAFNRHHKQKHQKKLTRLCRICQMKFSSMRDMWKHMWEVHNERSVAADCAICHKSFRRVWDLKAHVRTAHRTQMLWVSAGNSRMQEKRRRGLETFLQRTEAPVTLHPPSEELLVVYDSDQH